MKVTNNKYNDDEYNDQNSQYLNSNKSVFNMYILSGVTGSSVTP